METIQNPEPRPEPSSRLQRLLSFVALSTLEKPAPSGLRSISLETPECQVSCCYHRLANPPAFLPSARPRTWQRPTLMPSKINTHGTRRDRRAAARIAIHDNSELREREWAKFPSQKRHSGTASNTIPRF